MAERYRIATGNWSNAAQWDGGTTLPGAGDDCYANGFTCTIDQNVTVLTLRTTAGSVAVAGGTFNATTQMINANVIAGTTTCLTINGAGTLNGNSQGGASANARGVQLQNKATQNGNATGGSASGTFGTRAENGAFLNGNATGGSANFAYGASVFLGSVMVGNATGGSAGGSIGAEIGAANMLGNGYGSGFAQGARAINGSCLLGDMYGGTAANCSGGSIGSGSFWQGRCFGGTHASAYGMVAEAASGGMVAIPTQITDGTGPGLRAGNEMRVILMGTATQGQVNTAGMADPTRCRITRGTDALLYPFIRPPLHIGSVS